MEKKVFLELPKGKEAKNITGKMVDGKLQICYDLQDKFEPKYGDFIICEKGLIFIFDEYIETSYKWTYAKGYIGESRENNKIYASLIYSLKNARYATKEEKSAFLERVEKECNKKWNEEKKCLEDIYVPKFGDIVCIEHPDAEDYSRQYVISIFPNKEIPNKSKSGFFDIACIDMEGRLQINSEAYYNHGHVREATIVEKQELFRKLAAVRKRWNQKTKQIEDARWRAEKDCVYYTVINSGFVAKQTEKYCTVDYVNYKNNNYFRTPEAAQKVAEQIKEIFKNSKAE